VRTLLGCTMASLVFREPYSQFVVLYTALTAWIGANGYRFAGSPREVYLTMPEATGGDAVTELQWPVEKA